MKITELLFYLGILLLALNFMGFFLSLRNPDIYIEEKVMFKDDIVLDYSELKKQIIRLPNESNEDYVLRLNEVVNNGVAHYWLDEGIEKYNLRVPVWENYILYFASFIKQDVYLKYEYTNYERAMERGVGLCSQIAIISSGILNNEGIEAQLLVLDGHVVSRVKIQDNKWYIIDSDYGVIIPYDISEIEKNPNLIKEYYLDSEVHDMDWVVDVYGSEGNQVWYPTIRSYLEEASYVMIWLIPLFLMLPYFLAIFKN